jgi:hypothetical protein
MKIVLKHIYYLTKWRPLDVTYANTSTLNLPTTRPNVSELCQWGHLQWFNAYIYTTTRSSCNLIYINEI